MSSGSPRRGGGLVVMGGGLLLLVVVFLGLATPSASNNPANADDGPTPTSSTSSSPTTKPKAPQGVGKECGTELKLAFYPIEDKVRKSNLGRAVQETSDARKAFDEIAKADCNDPYLLASHYVGMGWTDQANDAAINLLADRYKANASLMQAHYRVWHDWWTNPKTSISIEEITGTYSSDYGVAGKDQMTITVKRDKSVQPVKGYKQLVGKNGNTTKRISLECMQAIHEGTSMPSKIPPTPQGNGGPPPSTYNTTTPPTTGTGGNCEDTGGCTTPPTTTTKPPCVPGDQNNDCPKQSHPNPPGVTSPGEPNPPVSEPDVTRTTSLTPDPPTTTTTRSVPPNEGGDN